MIVATRGRVAFWRWPLLAMVFSLCVLPLWGCAWAQDWPEEAVGRILRNGKGNCSAVLIERNVVLTAAHCVARRNPWKAFPARQLQVRIAGKAYPVAWVDLTPVSPFDNNGKIADLANDWAFLELAGIPSVEPIPYGGADAAGRAYALDEPMIKVGWRQLAAVGSSRRRDAECRIIEHDPKRSVFHFTCPDDAGEGRSGSALIVPAGDSYEVVGVQSGEAKNAYTRFGIAVSPAVP